MSSHTAPAAAVSAAAAASGAPVVSEEDELRRQLRLELQSLNRREPLDPTYKKLVLSRDLTNVIPTLSKDKFYKRIGSRLREKVERYMLETRGKDPFDRISQRKPMDEDAMRSAFTLREAKEHEQIPLLEATLAAQSMHPERKRHLDGIALALQTRSEKKPRSSSPKNFAQQTEDARRRAEIEAQREQARQWEETRKKLEEKERRRREEESYMAMRRKAESPQQALHKIIQPVFKKLWDMEFPALNKTNPFRIVIDRENCATIGAPDYFSVITIPMNLTYIKRKIDTEQYTTLQQFFVSVTYISVCRRIVKSEDPVCLNCVFSSSRAMWISCWPTPSNITLTLVTHIDTRRKK